MVWHTQYDFTIDFAALQRPEPTDPDDEESTRQQLARVVARIRIPASYAFDLIRTVHARMSAYEAEWGEIRRREPREPEDR